MPLGIRHIVAHEAVTLSNLVQDKEATYGDWYNDRLDIVTLEMTARTFSVSFCIADKLWIGLAHERHCRRVQLDRRTTAETH